MLHHLVIARARPSAGPEQIDEIVREWRGLEAQIPSVRSLLVGQDLGLRDQGAAIGAIAEFASVGEWRQFMEHPAHEAFRQNYSVRTLDLDTLAVVQFEQ